MNPSIRAELLGYADIISRQLIAAGKRSHADCVPIMADGRSYCLQLLDVLQANLDYELNEELYSALLFGDRDAIAGEMADVLYYAVQIDAFTTALHDYAVQIDAFITALHAVAIMSEVMLPALAPFGWGMAEVVDAARAKYAIRARDVKDHEMEAVAIRQALGSRFGG